MSTGPFARNPDLRRLRDDGYTVELQGSNLVMRDVPYVTPQKTVAFGVLAAPVTFAGEGVSGQEDHTAHFQGATPCDANGARLTSLINSEASHELLPGLTVNFRFSQKPPEGTYPDNYAKFTSYARLLGVHAMALDKDVTAIRFRPAREQEEHSPFVYRDSASSRVGIDAVNEVFAGHRVAIVGLGGTGSYILDLVAKTKVDEIHLFDDDDFVNHNAFRAPGAAPIEILETRPKKVDYLVSTYSHMRRSIIPHTDRITATSVDQLAEMTWVFLAADESADKADIVAFLDSQQIPFIDVGMGVEKKDSGLSGTLRVTTSLPGHREHARKRIAMSGNHVDGDYGSNIQIADLNMFNAAMAVVRWKRELGFYADLGAEGNSAYSIFTNEIVNEDQK